MTTTCQRGNLREYFLAVVIRNRTGGSLTERDVEECSWLLGCSNNSELFPSSANLPVGFEESFSLRLLRWGIVCDKGFLEAETRNMCVFERFIYLYVERHGELNDEYEA